MTADPRGTPAERFARCWAALKIRLIGPYAFAFDPERTTLRAMADQGWFIFVSETWPSDTVIAACPTDPEWGEPGIEEDDEPDTIYNVWPELRPHIPKDGTLRAVVTLSAMGDKGPHSMHEVRTVDPDTMALGAALAVVDFASA